METKADIKVQILLKEYDTLRNESIQKMGQRFALLTLAAGVVTLLSTQDLKHNTSMLCWLSCSALLLVWVFSAFHLNRLTKQLAKIESSVNSLVGEKLLSWSADCARNVLMHKILRFMQK